MLFNSWEFAVFLPMVYILYWSMPHKYRAGLLLVASYFFYMSWNPKYVLLILVSTLVSYLCGIGIEKFEKHKKAIVILSASLELGILFLFKYAQFVIDTAANILNVFHIYTLDKLTLSLILPVGISFYTFQTLSYIIDVYRGRVLAERNFGIYALYVSFFPQLVAGPIERPERLIPQFRQEKKFDYDEQVKGLLLIAWGLFQKICIADALSVFVDNTYSDLFASSSLAVLISVFMFSIQIYCDFAGYSTIAVGVAKLLGFELMQNFRSPYYASSIREFWKRWHISLTTWFTDYVYIPLGGNRVKKWKHYRNLFITLLLSGVWHGADWTFFIWGGYMEPIKL